jgi:hypothetical protein
MAGVDQAAQTGRGKRTLRGVRKPVVSANLTVPRRKEDVSCNIRLIANQPDPVPTNLPASRSEGSLVGITGMLVVAGILGLSVYFVLRYLL